jgi:hypothetical protein
MACDSARRPDAMQLRPIRSLHYFLPLIEELLAQPVLKSMWIICGAKFLLAFAAVIGYKPIVNPFSPSWLCSNFYVFTCAPTPAQPVV